MTVEELLANPAPADARETQQWALNTEWGVVDRLARALSNQAYAACNERGALLERLRRLGARMHERWNALVEGERDERVALEELYEAASEAAGGGGEMFKKEMEIMKLKERIAELEEAGAAERVAELEDENAALREAKAALEEEAADERDEARHQITTLRDKIRQLADALKGYDAAAAAKFGSMREVEATGKWSPGGKVTAKHHQAATRIQGRVRVKQARRPGRPRPPKRANGPLPSPTQRHGLPPLAPTITKMTPR